MMSKFKAGVPRTAGGISDQEHQRDQTLPGLRPTGFQESDAFHSGK